MFKEAIPFSLSCPVVLRKYDFSLQNVENNISPEVIVTENFIEICNNFDIIEYICESY